MGHLKSTRVGWENERLAEFLLSRISFIATPAKTSDDVGTDFICTLFKEQEMTGDGNKKWVELFPTQSFAIQVKTGAPSIVDITKHLGYLQALEMPFFLGFVEQQTGTLPADSWKHSITLNGLSSAELTSNWSKLSSKFTALPTRAAKN
jgi:hypothetical protein